MTDLIEGIAGLMELARNPGVPVNLGNPEEYTVNALAAMVLKLTGSASGIVHQPLPADDPRSRRPDIGRARQLLGWAPRVPVQRGLAATIDWFAGPGAPARPAARQPVDAAPDPALATPDAD